MDRSIIKKMINMAKEVSKNAYAPYSNFNVGACVLAEDDSYYTGVNVENVSYGATCCAERNAVYAAVLKGNKKIKAIAVFAFTNIPVTPCGICRQVIYEFSNADTVIICSDKNENYKEYKINEILPLAFGSDSLNDNK